MFYSDDIVEDIRSRSDIVDVISSYVNLKKKGSSYFGLCPFHSEKSPSFSVSQEKQMYYCFGCGAGGNVFTFLMEYENDTFPEALKRLAERAGVVLPEEEMSNEAKKEADYRAILKEMNKLSANYFYFLLHNERGRKGYEYLKNRGISDETIKHFGLGYADIYSDDLYRFLKSKGYTDMQLKDSGLVTIDEVHGGSDKFWNRVMYPIMDTNNKVIGFGGRVMGDGNPKYLNSKETAVFDKSRNLYGLNFAKSTRKSYMIICEGYMDVISMHQAGFTNAVASLGTAFTALQAMLIKRYTKEVILSYDSDEAGIKAALRGIPLLREAGLSVRILNLKPYKDPDEFMKELGKEEFEKRIQNAVSSFMFEISILAEGYNQNDPESKTAFYHELAKKLATIEEALERNNYIEAVAKEYFIGSRELTELVNRYGTMMPAKSRQTSNDQILREKKRVSEKENPKKQNQKLLLTWMVNEPILFEQLRGVITPDDFVEPVFHTVAQMLYKQYETEKKVMPAKIINQFTELSEQNEIAAIFNTTFKLAPLPEDNDKALTDVVKKVKGNSIDYEMSHSNDINRWQELIKEKADLQKLHISLRVG